MVLVIDIDGVLCEETKPYARAKVIDGAADALAFWETCMNYTIILHTSRREQDRKLTVKWLKDNNIIYNKLVMGKPKGDVYIDDKALKFNGVWNILL